MCVHEYTRKCDVLDDGSGRDIGEETRKRAIYASVRLWKLKVARYSMHPR